VIRLIIIEDDETIRRNLVLFSDFQSDIEAIEDYSSVESFMKRSNTEKDFDVMILDI
jgi:DNA-binding NarL/FixJ family response regulator